MIYKVSVVSSDLCGNTTVKHLGYSTEKLPELGYAFFELLYEEVVVESTDALSKKAEQLIKTADWRG